MEVQNVNDKIRLKHDIFEPECKSLKESVVQGMWSPVTFAPKKTDQMEGKKHDCLARKRDRPLVCCEIFLPRLSVCFL